MKSEQLDGYWILENRVENPIPENYFEVGDKFYVVKSIYIEILFFNTAENKCYQLGINSLPNQAGTSSLFEMSAFLPGSYNLEEMTLEFLDEGIMSFTDEKLSVKVKTTDNECDEIWKRLTDENKDLVEFLDIEMKNN